MFTNREQIRRRNTFARAVCSEELDAIYYSDNNPSFVFIIVCATIPIPLITLFLLVASVRKLDDSFINNFTHSSSHGTIVSMVLTGAVLSFGILAVDIISCVIVVSGNHEYSDFVEGPSINLYIAFATLIYNIIFILPLVLCIIYISVCFNGRNVFHRLCCRRSMACSVHPCISRIIEFVVGKYAYKKLSMLSHNAAVSLLFPLMIATPILCFSTHIGYIMLAWLTEPSKSTTIFLIYYGVLAYFFFAFRKCYNTFSGVIFTINLSKREDENPASYNASIELDAVDSKRTSGKNSPVDGEIKRSKGHTFISFERFNKEQHINTQTFCFLIILGLVIAGIAVMLALLFLLLPFAGLIQNKVWKEFANTSSDSAIPELKRRTQLHGLNSIAFFIRFIADEYFNRFPFSFNTFRYDYFTLDVFLIFGDGRMIINNTS